MNDTPADTSPGMTAEPVTRAELIRMAGTVTCAYLERNPLPGEDIPALILKIHQTLEEMAKATATPPAPRPAVPIKRSVCDDWLICLEDGRKLKMLKRYLRTTYGMSPEEYRARWGLPDSYPMVAPSYARQRAAFARRIGLGRGGNKTGD